MTPWVEARKPDGSVRERYCLREFKSSSYRDDVYAVSTTSATGRIIDLIGVKKQYVFFTADATNAFWQVPIQEVCFMYPPKEWLAEEKSAGRSTDVMWQLRTEWYGRRVAGTRWVEFAAGKIMKQGFKRCEIAPWFFYNAASDISLELHMDDIYGCGPKEKVESFLAELHKEILMKSEIHEAGGEEFSHLKKKRTYKEDGSMLIQADSKHIKEVQKILGMEEAKGCPTPAVAGGSSTDLLDQEVSEEEASRFKSAVGVLMYISPERPDAQYAIRELTKFLKKPTVGSMHALSRVVRYLIKTANYGIKFEQAGECEVLDCFSDTDWASCKRTRKSTACGVFRVGGCTLATYSRGLATISLSSGEAEFNGGVVACCEGLFYQQILAHLGVNVKMRVHVDSSAARGVFQRQGAGRIRHLEVKSLWVQEALRQRKFSLHAVRTDDNLADIGTKALQAAKLEKFRDELNVLSLEEFSQGDTEKIQTRSEVKEAEKGISVVHLMVWFSVFWTVVSIMWMILRSWMTKEKVNKSKIKEEGMSQEVTTEVVNRGDGEQSTTRRRGAQSAREFADAATLAEIASSSEDRSGNTNVSTAVERVGRRMFYYEVTNGQPLLVYKSAYGECVHINPQCHGLRNRRTGIKSFRMCMYCHEDNLKHVEFMSGGQVREQREGLSQELARLCVEWSEVSGLEVPHFVAEAIARLHEEG